MTPNIIEAITDRNLLGTRLTASPSWRPWRAVLAALFGLTMDDCAAALFRACTGRATPPSAACDEGWLVCGRRAGKSYVLALIGVFLGCFRDYRPYLVHGERATVMIIATDRRQARVIFRYIRGIFEQSKMLGQMVERETAEAFDLSNSVTIEVMTASHRTLRGYSVAAVLADELAFWPVDGAVASDEDILAAVRPAMATIPGSMLICASSPYARRGALWAAYKRHYGQDDTNVPVWQAATRTMNSTVPRAFIDRQFELDPISAEAEYDAQFRSDIEGFIDRAVIEGLIMSGRHELPPSKSFRYFGFVDPSGGGGQDSYCLAIAHVERDGVIVLDCLREIRAPFDPQQATAELAATARSYSLSQITGDRYAGQWPSEQWRAHGVAYRFSERSKSELYGELLPLLNAGKLELLDHPRLINQLASLERRTARGTGRDSIDHPTGPNYHDDVANVLAGVAASVTRRPNTIQIGTYGYGGRAYLLEPGWRGGFPEPPGPYFPPIPQPRSRGSFR